MCPKCRSRMFSEWCWACSSEWVPRTFCTDLPAPDPPRRVCRGTGRVIFERVLTNEEVSHIKATLAATRKYGTNRGLARKFGVSEATISRLAAGLRRADVRMEVGV